MALRRLPVISTVVVALAGVGAWYGLEHAEHGSVEKAAAAPVPVTVAIASREDLPIYLTGLGTVQASFTVGIRAQVVGKLEQVLFKEGDHFRKGDVLAKIDPRLSGESGLGDGGGVAIGLLKGLVNAAHNKERMPASRGLRS